MIGNPKKSFGDHRCGSLPDISILAAFPAKSNAVGVLLKWGIRDFIAGKRICEQFCEFNGYSCSDGQHWPIFLSCVRVIICRCWRKQLLSGDWIRRTV
jgi:hypothetical protein